MSEPKETTERDLETDPESKAEAEAEAHEGEVLPAPNKKRKTRSLEEGDEPIRDRNQRVRAEAAQKRRGRRDREQLEAPRRNLDAGEVVDDALARSTHAAGNFLRRNFNKLQWAIMLGLVGWIAWEVYAWRHERNAEKNTSTLFKALSAETGRVGGKEGGDADPRTGITDPRRGFASDEERLKAAKAEYVLASSQVGQSSSMATLATLGTAGVAYDLGQHKEAKAAYEKVRSSELFGSDTDVKGRTLEGLGMTLEALKDTDGALKAFRELQNLDAAGFSTLGLYHQARILKDQAKKDDAIKLIAKAGEKLLAAKDALSSFKYLTHSVLELFETLDEKAARELRQKLTPAEIPQLGQGSSAGPGGGQQLSQEKLQELLNELAKKNPPAPAGGDSAPAPAPAPSGAP